MIHIADGNGLETGLIQGRQNEAYKMMKPIGQRATLITDLSKLTVKSFGPSSFCPHHSVSHSDHSKMARLRWTSKPLFQIFF